LKIRSLVLGLVALGIAAGAAAQTPPAKDAALQEGILWVTADRCADTSFAQTFKVTSEKWYAATGRDPNGETIKQAKFLADFLGGKGQSIEVDCTDKVRANLVAKLYERRQGLLAGARGAAQ